MQPGSEIVFKNSLYDARIVAGRDDLSKVAPEFSDPIVACSEEGREIIAKTVRLLEQKLTEISQSAETHADTDDSV